jgi:hypothetical protein
MNTLRRDPLSKQPAPQRAYRLRDLIPSRPETNVPVAEMSEDNRREWLRRRHEYESRLQAEVDAMVDDPLPCERKSRKASSHPKKKYIFRDNLEIRVLESMLGAGPLRVTAVAIRARVNLEAAAYWLHRLAANGVVRYAGGKWEVC